MERIRSVFNEHVGLVRAAEGKLSHALARAVDLTLERLRRGGRIYIMGNGGSAADALHWVGELMGRFTRTRPPIPSVALVCNPAVVTAVGNDLGFEQVFARQVSALVGGVDIVVAISTSGGSANVVAALEAAGERACLRIGFTGEGGGKMGDLVDVLLDVPSRDTARVQEVHGILGHLYCELLEAGLYGPAVEP